MRGQRLARNLLIAHGEIVDDGRCDRSGLLQVVFEYVIVGVHIGMRSAGGTSFHIVAYPLEAWQSDFIERNMIAGANIGDGYRGCAEVSDGVKRATKDRLGGHVP